MKTHSQSLPSVPEHAMPGKQSELVNLMVHLNEVIERNDGDMRDSFYQTSAQAQIDKVFNKLQTLSKSKGYRRS